MAGNQLVEFTKHLKSLLASRKREPHWTSAEAESYMTEVQGRRQRFEELAVRLNDTVIQPRLETLAGYFANATVTEDEPAGHCACWFGYCERFPASTKVAFAVEHDPRFEKLAVCYEASMTPVFIKFNEHDRMTVALDDLDDDRVAEWVEERLTEFLEAYLRIDRGGDDFEQVAATDPVCGMRIQQAAAAASDAYRGHPYYFCSADCQREFTRDPTVYVQVKTM